MKKAIVNIKPSISFILKDPVNFLFALIPVLIGLAAYYFVGMNFYEYVMREGQAYINSYIQAESTWGAIVYYVLAAVLTVILFFVVNWTFVIFVSIIASPFNDMLSSRIEKKMLGQKLETLSESFGRMIRKILWTLWNEVKKILVIVVIASIGLVFSYIPFLTPISFLISALLLASQFIDYSWSRHNYTIGKILSDLRKNVFSYTLMGVVFFVFVSIPLLNILVPPLATSYFTVLFLELNGREDKNCS